MTVKCSIRKNVRITLLYEWNGQLMIELNNNNQFILMEGGYELRWKALDEGTEPYLVINEQAYFWNSVIPCVRVYDGGVCEIVNF